MNRRQLLGAGIATAVSRWLPGRSHPLVLKPQDALIPVEFCGDGRILTKNTVIATLIHKDFTDDEANGSHSRFLSFGFVAQGAA